MPDQRIVFTVFQIYRIVTRQSSKGKRKELKRDRSSRILTVAILPGIALTGGLGFALLVISIVAAVLYLLYRNRLRELEKEKEEEIQKRSRILKEQFLANMSHEFRTPLNAITGMTRLLREKDPRPDQVRYLDAIRSSSESLLLIINDILDISKIEAGRLQLEPVPFEPKQIMDSIYNSFHLKAEEKKIDFNVETSKDVPAWLLGDATRLTQILFNVTGNAIKFTEEGSVSLHCSAVNTKKGDNGKVNLRFSITDTGIGIDQESRERIFETFSQVVDGATRKHGGAGLGLSITRKLTDLFGGEVKVQSETGKGSEFIIELPFEVLEGVTQESFQGQSAANVKSALKDLYVLLVEDIEFNRIVAIDTLKTELEGVKVDVAVNGKEAVELASRNQYDIILMDLQMPELNGYDASRKIRELPAPYSTVPVVAMTASALQDEIHRCYEAGMNDFITKPFETEVLLRKILNQVKG